MIRPVVVDGVRYPSIKDAAVANGWDRYQLTKAMQVGNVYHGVAVYYEEEVPVERHEPKARVHRPGIDPLIRRPR